MHQKTHLMNKKKILESGLFDPDWYQRKYPDVPLTGIDPLEHFCKYGGILKRSPNPAFDSRFYSEVYGDLLNNLSPVEHFLSLDDYASRPTSREAFQQCMEKLNHSTQKEWLSNSIGQRKDIEISYCIPIMGRLKDIQGTLADNLRENSIYREKIEFILIEFSQQPEAIIWAQENFAADISDGYLRTIHDPDTLDTWHFGKAKNAFRPYVWGKFYSSLDGDNFVTKEETEHLLSLINERPDGFIFHHFSGIWGDGTSGRVSMPAAIYRHIGYDPNLLPRQFDEMDLILGALIEFPALPFIGVSADRNIFTLSKLVRQFFDKEKLGNRRIYEGFSPHRRAPLNPRGAGYTEKTPHWRDMNIFNASVSALKRGKNDQIRKENISRVERSKYSLIESLPKNEVLETLFYIESSNQNIDISPSDICVVTCVKDEEYFLSKFITHHRSLGASHFLIVDDNSQIPVSSLDLGKNVIVVRPKVGDFRTAKTLWLEGLMKAVVPEGTWICTLDADELLELPSEYQSLQDLAEHISARGSDFATCLLIDMLPDPHAPTDKLLQVEEAFDTIFTYYCNREEPVSEEYTKNSSIQWGFGKFADISWRVDARYHAFGTFDSLRKLSMFRYRPHRHLNQGFHSFHYIDGTPSPNHDVWRSPIILPIRHYKLVKLFSEAKREKMLEIADGYHSRTKQNISQIFSEDTQMTLQRIKTLLPWLHPARELSYTRFSTQR